MENNDITILLIDDALEIHALVRHYLRKSSYKLETVCSITEADQFLSNTKVDLIILDIMLGAENGLEYLKIIRQKYNNIELPIIIATSLNRSRDVAVGIQTGANDYLKKPFAESEFLARIESQLILLNTNRQLQSSRMQFKRMVDNLPEIIYHIDFEKNEPAIHFISPAIKKISGYDENEFLTNNDLIIELTYGNWKHYLNIITKSVNKSIISRWLVKNDKIIWVENQPVAICDNKGKLISIEGVIRDITSIKAWDPLTGLPNKTLLLDTIEQSFRQDKNDHQSLIIIGLRKFELINQSLGHAFSEKVLIESAQRLQENLKNKNNVILSRVEEACFAILVSDISEPDEISLFAKALQDIFGAPFEIEHHTTHLSVNIGISVRTNEMENAADLLRAAELAMHTADKKKSLVPVIYNTDLANSVKKLVQLESDIHKAVYRKEFILYGQPILDTHSGTINKVELLLRWQHPKQGLIPPDIFIPYLEDSRLILPVGEWILKQACRFLSDFASSYPEDSKNFLLSVNFSALQLHEPDIAERVAKIIEEAQTEPGKIEIEMTESVLFGTDRGQNLLNLEELREVGVKLALDDFGTGYSSLSYLKFFPVHTLKIDRSFIINIETRDRSLAILRAIINLATELKLNVVTEGIETEAQYQILSDLGCQYLQGYLIARPMPVTELPDFIHNYNKTSRNYTNNSIQYSI